jgi:acyl-CoA synthetase (AMP-forming)/AMP-acid ligase II
MWRLIEERAARTPDALLAVDERDRELTFAAYRRRCEEVAAALLVGGDGRPPVAQGTVVAWQLPTWLEALVLAGALSRLGAVQVPMLPVHRERELGHVADRTGTALLVVPQEFRGFDHAAMAASIGPPLLVVDPAHGRDLPTGDPAALPPAPDGPEVRWIFATSGTESTPKLVLHADATVAAAARGVNFAQALGADDRFALVFPVTHVGGIQMLMGALQNGYGLILTETFVPGPAVDTLARHGVTVAGAGTAFWLAYLSEQRRRGGTIFPALKAMVGGGSPKPPELVWEIWREFGVPTAGGYGLTECPSHCLGAVFDPLEKLVATDGRPMEGVEMRVDAASGELRVKGPMTCLGFLDPAHTAAAFDDDGWLRTGDLGEIDDDGYVTITGRLKDVIIRKGENISAKEVEDLLYAHPAITDVAVIGLPDAERGERACAVVVSDRDLTVAELGEFCVAHGLARYKVPEQVARVDALPRNTAGKVVKFELRSRFG